MISAYKFLDKYAGVPLCLIAGGINKIFSGKKIQRPKRIAVLKLWAIGDSVLSLPMIRSLKKSFPEAKIDVIARKRNMLVFQNNSDINKIVLFEPQNFSKISASFKKYDLVIDAEPWMRLSALLSLFAGKKSIGFGGQARAAAYTKTVPFDRKKHMVLNYLEMAKSAGAKKIESRLVPLNVSAADKKAVDKFIKEKNLSKKLIGICPGAAESARSRIWDKFALLSDKLCEKHNCKIVFIGSPGEKKLIEQIRSQMRLKNLTESASGNLTLPQTFNLIKRCSLFISNDTGPMHIAAAQGVPTIGLFGPNTPALWAPYNSKSISIYKNISCSPCIINEKGITPECRRKTNKNLCMKLIEVDEVLRACQKCLEK